MPDSEQVFHSVTAYVETDSGVIAVCECSWRSELQPDRQQAADRFEVHRIANQ